MKLPPGKIPVDLLKEVVFKNLGADREEVIVGPSAGVDGAVLDLGAKSLVVSMDPITGAVERIGWLAVNVNANDVATFGVQPAFLFSCMMLPENAERKLVETISAQMNAAAKELGIAIVGGHCESTPGLSNPIVVGCILGLTEKRRCSEPCSIYCLSKALSPGIPQKLVIFRRKSFFSGRIFPRSIWRNFSHLRLEITNSSKT